MPLREGNGPVCNLGCNFSLLQPFLCTDNSSKHEHQRHKNICTHTCLSVNAHAYDIIAITCVKHRSINVCFKPKAEFKQNIYIKKKHWCNFCIAGSQTQRQSHVSQCEPNAADMKHCDVALTLTLNLITEYYTFCPAFESKRSPCLTMTFTSMRSYMCCDSCNCTTCD